MNNTIIILVIAAVFTFRRLRKSSNNTTQKTLLLVAEIVGVIWIIAQFPFVHDFIDRFKGGVEHPQAVADNMSEEETRNIMISISKCWNITEKEKNLPIVQIYVHLNPDASIQTIHVIDAEKDRYNNDAIFRETADRAMNSLKACPLNVSAEGKI